MTKHPRYFMKQEIYDFANRLKPVLKKVPFNHLNQEDPLTILHHLNAHGISKRFSRERGDTEELLSEGHQDIWVLTDLIRDYVYSNNVHSTYNNTLPKSEKDVGRRALAVNLLVDDYWNVENVSKNLGEVRFDLVPS